MTKATRRAFLRDSSVALGAVLIAPVPGRASANDKLNLAFIGAGGRAGRNIAGCDIKTSSGSSTNNIVALCDVNSKRAAGSFKSYPKAKRYEDFRRMFDEMGDQIDAVVVSTPDHTHFAATMAAMQLGKHVYVEKPLAHNIWELRTLKKAAAHYGVVTQMGNQGHTTNGIRLVKEWYEAGVLGEVREVIAWHAGPTFKKDGYFYGPEEFPPEAKDVPSHLNWDAWLGPKDPQSYTKYYEPRFWRAWYDFGNGLLGDWACHTLDAPFWSLDLGMPTQVKSMARRAGSKDFVSEQSYLQFEFAARGSQPPVTMHWYEGGLKPALRPEWGLEQLDRSGMIMVGSKCSLMTGGRPNNPVLLMPDDELKAFMEDPPAQTIARVDEENPQAEWIKAIKGQGPKCLSSFDYGADLTEMAVVGVMAQRFHTDVHYDAASMKITNHEGMDQFIKEPMRDGWSYGEELWKS